MYRPFFKTNHKNYIVLSSGDLGIKNSKWSNWPSLWPCSGLMSSLEYTSHRNCQTQCIHMFIYHWSFKFHWSIYLNVVIRIARYTPNPLPIFLRCPLHLGMTIQVSTMLSQGCMSCASFLAAYSVDSVVNLGMTSCRRCGSILTAPEHCQ